MKKRQREKVNYPVQDNQELELESEDLIISQEASLLKKQKLDDFKKDLELQRHLADENDGKISCSESLNKKSCSGNNQLLNKNWKSVFDDLSDDDKNCFYEKTSLPIKDYRNGLSLLVKNLDQNERLNDIIDYFELHENDRIKILLACYGGGNPAKSLFEKLEQYKPDLKIKDLCKCLETLGLNGALESLKSFKYSDEEKVSKINKIHLTSFTYKLISFNANDQPWKDVAFELLGSKEDVNTIARTIKHPNTYNPTEKLIDILSSSRSTTIQEFLDALKELKILDAHELMCQKIIAKIKEEEKIEKK
ncbi:uncharacterized protein LOC136090355 isoform X2 [Hydra vulgaris]|uniref:Uncharacterized protein LOC136090355 isoform X2 n=1 Tax=Hydra vulgaris TaxID=6087 RepID=A0ABM4DF30_HYDVU